MPTIESTLTPTATLVFEREAAPSREGFSPLILGGGLAAIVIVALFAGILMRKR